MAAITSAPHFIRSLSTRTTCGEGSTVTLEATVSGRPRPVVTWHKNGSPVLLRAGHDRHAAYDSESGRCRLVIGSANEGDEGEYECRAKNILGQVSCFGELYVIRHTAGRSAGHSARMTTRMGSPLTDDSTNDEPEIKSGLFILIDEGSQDEENSDELGHRGSISASEQIESIIEDLTLADGSLNLSLAKDGTFVSEDGSIRGEDADDSKDLKMFKSKKLGDYFVDDDDDDIVEDSGNVFEDPDYDDGFDPMRYARPNGGGGGRTYARHRSHVETGPWNREKRRDKPPATAASLHLHKVNAEERLNEVFDYSADGTERPIDDDLLEVSNARTTSDMFQGEEDRPPFFDDINASLSSRRGKIKSENYELNFEGLDTWKASTNVPVVLPPPLGSRRFTTTDEADQDLEVLPHVHGKVVRQRSNSDGKLPAKADDCSCSVPVENLKTLDCPWDSTDKIWNDSIGTSDQSDRALANSDVDGSNEEVFSKDQIGVVRREDLHIVTADNNVAEFQVTTSF